MGDSPVWLLDFDGTVNALARKPDRTVFNDWQFVEMSDGVTTHPVWYSPTVVRFIAAAHDAGARIFWLTDWLEHTEQFPRMIPGMPALPWLPKPPGGSDADDDDLFSLVDWRDVTPWWKHLAARDAAGEDVPLLWTDDDLGVTNKKIHLARHWLTGRPSPTLAMSPVHRLGFTPRRLREIAGFFSDVGVMLPG